MQLVLADLKTPYTFNGKIGGYILQRYSPIPLSLPMGNFLSPFPLRVRAKTLVSSRGCGRSAMATFEHSTAPRSSPGKHGYTGLGGSLYGPLSQVQASAAKSGG